MYTRNARVLPLDQAFVVGEGVAAITYPPNWLRQATAAEREAIGIVEVAVMARPDDRYYFVTDLGDGSYSALPRPLEPLKEALVTQVKQTAQQLLVQTSWYIERSMDPSSREPVPPAIVAQRQAIRARVDALESEIRGCGSVEGLAGVRIAWP